MKFLLRHHIGEVPADPALSRDETALRDKEFDAVKPCPFFG
jgi:hypothetical protein